MGTTKKMSRRTLTKIAVQAEVDYRTVQNYFYGKQTPLPMTVRAIERAVEELGIKVPKRRRVSR